MRQVTPLSVNYSRSTASGWKLYSDKMGHVLILLDEMGLEEMGFGIRLKINPGCKYQTQNIHKLKKQDISKLSGVHE